MKFDHESNVLSLTRSYGPPFLEEAERELIRQLRHGYGAEDHTIYCTVISRDSGSCLRLTAEYFPVAPARPSAEPLDKENSPS